MYIIVYMANSIFDVDDKVFKQLNAYFRESPKEFQSASGNVLDGMAFGTRTGAIKNIHQTMTVRSDPFVRRSLIVRKSSKNAPIDSQMAKLETNPKTVKTGWAEQETGEKSRRPFTVGIGARNGQFGKQIPKRYRINAPARTINQFKFRNTGEARRWGFVAMMRRDYPRQQFYLDKQTGKLDKGRMTWSSKNKLRYISNPGRKHQPKKRPWMQPAAKQYMSSNATARLWQKSLLHTMNKYLRI